jgi:hypothetical protein
MMMTTMPVVTKDTLMNEKTNEGVGRGRERVTDECNAGEKDEV